MKYTSIILHLLFALAMFLLLAGTKINLKPFKISFDSFYTAIGWVLIISGVLFIKRQTEQDYIKSWDERLKPLEEKAIENVERSQKQLDELKEKNAEQKWHNVDTKK